MIQNNRILVVDDNEAIHADFKKVLGGGPTQGALNQAAASLFEDEPIPAIKRNYEIDSAYQGQDGLVLLQRSIAEERPYALAFVDIRMPPGWDGIETVQRFWEVSDDLQVVICTAYSDYSWTEMIQKLGETDRLVVIKKPFDNIEVRQIACALTTKWALTREVNRNMSELTAVVDQRTAALAAANGRLRVEVAEKQHAAEVLRDTEARMRAIVETAVDGILTINEIGTIELFNPAAETIFGYTMAEVVGKQFAILMPAELSGCYQDYLADFRATGKANVIGTRTETRGRKKDGSLFFSELSVTESCVGGVRRFTGIVRDLTRQKQLETQLLQSQKLESVGQLAAGIAHEINTPTQYVGDNTRFLQEAFVQVQDVLTQYDRLLEAVRRSDVSNHCIEEIDAVLKHADLIYLMREVPQAIEQSLEGVERIATIVGAMKSFSHPGTGEKTCVNLNDALRTTATVAANEWKYVADLEFDLDTSLPLVPCLAGEMNQVWLNLIVNAAHAIEEGMRNKSKGKGLITIKSSYIGEWMEVRITDTGSGVPEALRDRIFDPFFTTKPVGKGTGQGLAIVRDVVVNKHGGTITFNSELGCGTTFIVRLPLGSAVASPQVLPSTLQEATDLEKTHSIR